MWALTREWSAAGPRRERTGQAGVDVDLTPSLVAAAIALVVSGAAAWVNHRLGLDTATARYIHSLEGLVKARDAELADLRQRVADLEAENRRLERRLEALERA